MPQRHYKYLLSAVTSYNETKSFEDYWKTVMPMFKYHLDFIHIFRGLRRFLAPNHKSSFDAMMSKHFIVE